MRLETESDQNFCDLNHIVLCMRDKEKKIVHKTDYYGKSQKRFYKTRIK